MEALRRGMLNAVLFKKFPPTLYSATGARYIWSVVTEEYLNNFKAKKTSNGKLNERIQSCARREVALQIKPLKHCGCLEIKRISTAEIGGNASHDG